MSSFKESLKEARAKQVQQEQLRQRLIEECCCRAEGLISNLSCLSVFEEVNAEIFGGKAKITKERGSFGPFVLCPDYGVKIRLRTQKDNKEINLVAFTSGSILPSGKICFIPELVISCSSRKKLIGGWSKGSYEKIRPAVSAHPNPDEDLSFNKGRVMEVVAKVLAGEGIGR